MKLNTLTVNGTTYDDFPDKSAVKTINGTAPDENGNVGITIPDSGQNLELDTTLTQSGKAADAKAVGDKIAAITGISMVEPAEDDIPKVYFTGTLPTSKDDGDLQLFMRYISKTARLEYPVTLKVQGSSSATYPKKNFTLKLYKDSTYESKKKLAFKNWPEMNKFVLKAHWIDHSHVRNVGTAKIWSKIVASRSDYDSLPEELRNAPNNGATDGFTCKVFCNGVYQGLYEWIVPKDKLFGQDSDIATHSILNSEYNNSLTCAFAASTTAPNGWSEELQDSMSSEISGSFANLITFVASSTDEEFVRNAENYFDVQSVIDFNIFARVFCIVDNLCRNQIFFTYDGVKWYEGCWDVDAVLGLPPLDVWNWLAHDTHFQTGYVAYRDYGIINLLYDRVEKLFLDRFKARYAELRNGVLSADNIIDVYERLTDVIKTHDGLLEEDYANTTAGGAFTDIPYITMNTIQQIRNFVAMRLQYMDNEIASMVIPVPCTGITLDKSTLTFTTDGTQTLTATVTPDGCTDPVTWESDNEGVATVNGGVVAVVANGSATIIAKCGNYSASCSVVVSGVTKVKYSITNNMTNVINSNSTAVVDEGDSYSATLTADDGYKLSDVTVTMGGSDITATAYAGGVVNITSVTGNVIITATATEKTTTNVAKSFEDSTWEHGYYDNDGTFKTNANVYHSQFIPVHSGRVIANVDNMRIVYFDTAFCYVSQEYYGTSCGDIDTNAGAYYVVCAFGDDKNQVCVATESESVSLNGSLTSGIIFNTATGAEINATGMTTLEYTPVTTPAEYEIGCQNNSVTKIRIHMYDSEKTHINGGAYGNPCKIKMISNAAYMRVSFVASDVTMDEVTVTVWR